MTMKAKIYEAIYMHPLYNRKRRHLVLLQMLELHTCHLHRHIQAVAHQDKKNKISERMEPT